MLMQCIKYYGYQPFPFRYSHLVLLLVLSARYHLPALLQHAFKVFVYGECNSLTRRNTHDARCNSLIETADALLFPHFTMQVSIVFQESKSNNITYFAILTILFMALTPGSAGVFCSLVLIVSIGAFVKGPTAPERSPISDVS